MVEDSEVYRKTGSPRKYGLIFELSQGGYRKQPGRAVTSSQIYLESTA